MRLLMIFASRFAYRTSVKALASAPECEEARVVENAVVALIHAEPSDEANLSAVETKLVKNLKWAARKNETSRVVLHTFSHLGHEKASPDFTKSLLDHAETRLRQAGYEVFQTPFGYFLDLDLSAPGHSLARLFQSF